ncbi:hypothetical protein RRG08_058281 [Elysia crispata]|uniref:Uncharacterized protein n=1 Tax=Elysia crispata TaxID=231223 RepID=A0AAE1D5E1_9GAST|nr:hypothetical protein RRG08_058281 [Elysia crispata]
MLKHLRHCPVDKPGLAALLGLVESKLDQRVEAQGSLDIALVHWSQRLISSSAWLSPAAIRVDARLASLYERNKTFYRIKSTQLRSLKLWYSYSHPIFS